MATEYDVYKMAVNAAIEKLKQNGYLCHDLDWDVAYGRFTLRIRGVKGEPMAAVALISFRKKGNIVVLIDAVTGMRFEYRLISENGKTDKEGFFGFILDHAQKLRDEAAYLKL